MHPILSSIFLAQLALTASTQQPVRSGLAWGDYDADGRADLLVLDGSGPGRLLRNRGDGGFDDVTGQTGLTSEFVPRLATWCDVNGDGHTDLVLAGPAGLRLMLGDGALFRDATALAGLDAKRGVQALHWLDFDGDGRDDLQLTTDQGAQLYRNLGRGEFEPVDLGIAREAEGVARVVRPSGATKASGGNTLVSAQPLGSVPLTVSKAAGICAGTIADQALGGCIPASAVPALGSLLPLSIDFNVDLAGNVGMGTSAPASRLHVVGDVRAEGRLISTAASGAPLTVASSARVVGLNADLLDGVDAAAFSQLGDSIESGEITDGTVTAADLASNSVGAAEIAAGAVGNSELATGAVDTTKIADGTLFNSDVASNAAIAGTKVSPDFGSQTLRTTGQVGIGTASPERALHVMAGSAGAVTSQGNSIAVFERSTNGYVSILTPSGSDKGILFGNPTSNVSGGIVYDQASVGPESMQFRTGGNATRMTITQDGDVGIGTSAPSGKLHVADGAGGNGSVVLPASSISDGEILDEPGLANAKAESLFSLTASAQTLLSRSINVPSSGYVLATATMTVGVGPFAGGNAFYGINTDGNLASGSLESRFFSDAGAVKDAHQVVHQAVFNLTSAGTKTFYLQAQETSGVLDVTNRRLTLIFLPTAYGTVSFN